jgi:hypothetical protein
VVRDIILAVLSTVVLFLFVQNGQLKKDLYVISLVLSDKGVIEFLEREEKE